MTVKWRLLDMPPLSAAEHMALDEVLLEIRGQGRSQDTFRFLQFNPATVLVGFHQSIQEEIRLEYCDEQGIDINRRITGGGAIYFDKSQLGWELICQKEFFGVTVPNSAVFEKLCVPTVTALQSMGINATFRPRNDIEVVGRKISGTGGTDSDEAFLFQGSLLVDFDVETMLRCLRVPVEKLKDKEINSIKQRVTCLAWELGRVPQAFDIKEHIIHAVEEHMQIKLVPGSLSMEEEDLLAKRLTFFRSPDWIDSVRPIKNSSQVVQAARKSPYGLVRVSLQLNRTVHLLKDIFITGDFLSFPARALYDLEAALRGQALSAEIMCKIVHDFFDQGKIHIPDMSAEDICIPLRMALEKVEIAKHGIPLELCNRINTSNGNFDAVIKAGPQALLLPYCAKLKDCDLRFSRECIACGACTVGEAWTLGQEHGLETLCITKFEHLMQELNDLKAKGVTAFIGCCCHAFYVKHAEEFEELGLPGIFIDIENTTCYELNQSDAAHKGEFREQTQVHMELLHKILEIVKLSKTD